VPFSQGLPLQDSQSPLARFLPHSKSDFRSSGTAEAILALTTNEVSMLLWENDILGQVPLMGKIRSCLLVF